MEAAPVLATVKRAVSEFLNERKHSAPATQKKYKILMSKFENSPSEGIT